LLLCSIAPLAACSSSGEPDAPPTAREETLRASEAVTSSVVVLTNRYDNARTGVNTQETQLTPGNVNQAEFGQLFSRTVAGQIYADPLYVSNVEIPGGVRNVVYIATEHDMVYAFDADNPAASSPLWTRDVGPSGLMSQIGCQDITDRIGVTSTPVIDPTTGTLYVAAKVRTTSTTTPWLYQLRALDIVTGADRPNSPVTISAVVPGTGAGSSGGHVTFNPFTQLNRDGLLLAGSMLYIAFASHCDHNSYHGWIFAYDTTNLTTPPKVYITSPNGSKGGIWQSGVGLTADANGVYTAVGNGSTNPTGAPQDTSESALRLGLSDLSVQDFFTPAAYAALNSKDNDLNTGMPLVTAHDLFLTGNKAGNLYLLHRLNLGGFHAGGDQIIQTVNPGGVLHDAPIYFNVPGGQETVYVWPANRQLIAYPMAATGTLGTPRTGPVAAAQHPGGAMTISTNGSTPGTGILWASAPESSTTGPGVLYAFNPKTLALLWSSTQNASRDGVGTFAKFTRPVVANGRVYMATHDGLFRVYGLLSSGGPDAGADSGHGGACVTAAGGAGFVDTPIPAQTGTFTLEYDATPSISPSNGVFGLSKGAQTTYAAFSVDIRFNATGDIDAYNGTAAGYQAATVIPYSGGVTYHFRLVVNNSAQTYSAFVTPPGASELTIGQNFTFRAAATSLDTWGFDTHSGSGSTQICKVTIP
jgi:hypothetical protein